MRYTVVWRETALQQLALIWMAAADRAAVNRSVDEIDAELSQDPDLKGNDYFGDRYILAGGLWASWDRDIYATSDEWSRAVGLSSVRLQWDPDHHPSGAKLDRRAIQLGLRGSILEAFGNAELLEVIDLSQFVAEQLSSLSRGVSGLVTPRERVYTPADPAVSSRLGLATPEPAHGTNQ